jgi:uncharacterized protein YndB with AHSA1/START domain
MTDLGTYLEHAGRPAVRFERTYAHPIERVWAAVSEPAELARWFPSTVSYEPVIGGAVTFSGDPNVEDSTGTVLAFDPPHRLSFSWLDDELHFTLEQVGEGTRLTLLNVLADRSAAARNASGWYVCLAGLAKLVDGQPAAGPHDDDAEPWQPAYEAHVRAGLPSGAEIPHSVS